MIAKEDIDRIKAVSLFEAIGHEVVLKKKGSEYVGLSPFGNEKSASFTVNETKKVWKCFHSGKGGKTAVDFYMALDLHFGGDGNWLAACKKVAGLMNITIDGVVVKVAPKPGFHKRALNEGENPGDKIFKLKDFTPEELKIIGPKVAAEHCQHFHLHSVEMMTIVKETEVFEISSTEDYPIFVFDFGDWKKVYQPNAENKSNRFTYSGKKPSKFIHGLAQLEKKYNENKAKIEAENQDKSDSEKDKDPDNDPEA